MGAFRAHTLRLGRWCTNWAYLAIGAVDRGLVLLLRERRKIARMFVKRGKVVRLQLEKR